MNTIASRAVRSRWFRIPVLLSLVLGAWYVGRRALRPGIAPPDTATLAHVRSVRILRDGLGVPHIFGRTDADAAFGLAYAHAEDDFPLIQGVSAASTGRLGLHQVSMQALINDYYANLIQIDRQVAEGYRQLAPEYRAVLEGYARGLNYYAYQHPEGVNTALLPFKGEDLAAAFAHKIPYMAELPRVLKSLLSDNPPVQIGDTVLALGAPTFPGSNSHAVAAFRSPDSTVRLNVNSHQPYEGPVAWYEAHIVSETGWNTIGGLFPGAPVILHGHNQYLGWAHTVNKPDIIDVYKLTVNAQETQYLLDGKWMPLGRRTAKLRLDLGLFTVAIPREVFESSHGPVMKTTHGFFAIRYAGIGRAIFAGEQWYRMNRARNLAEWKQAMRIQGIPMFNTIYADKNNILYVYNALLPQRPAGLNYSRVLPGDRSDLIWNAYLPFDRLPMVTNPPSGFLQNCNTTPYRTTTGPGNPRPQDFAAEYGIEMSMNNRGLRSLALFSTPGRISREQFLRYKWDRTYDRTGPMYETVIRPLLKTFRPQGDDEREALRLVEAWNGVANEESAGAALAIFTLQAISTEIPRAEFAHLRTPAEAFREAIAFLKRHFGRLDVRLADVQRLRRPGLDIGLGGGTDLLNCIHSTPRDGRWVAVAGDSYIMLVEFSSGGVKSFSRHQYGSSSRPDSPHYTDQGRAFAARTLRPTLLTEDAIRADPGSREYTPGEEQAAPR